MQSTFAVLRLSVERSLDASLLNFPRYLGKLLSNRSRLKELLSVWLAIASR